MNIILFLTIIILFMIFTYQLIVYSNYKTREAFKAELSDIENNKPLQETIQNYYNIFPKNKVIKEAEICINRNSKNDEFKNFLWSIVVYEIWKKNSYLA